MRIRWEIFGAAASALLVYGCSTGDVANALDQGQSASASETMAQVKPATVDNFMLVDAQKLEAHELYRLSDAKAIVLVSTGNGCPIARSMMPALKALRDN